MKNGMRAIHPGEIWREEYLIPSAKSVEDFVADLKQKGLDVDQSNVEELQAFSEEKLDCRVDLAALLAAGTGSSGNFWLNLQATYDRRVKGE